jgi:hypothetical protein
MQITIHNTEGLNQWTGEAIAVIDSDGNRIDIRAAWAGGYLNEADIEELPHTAYGDAGDRLWQLAQTFEDWPTLPRPYRPLSEILEGVYE